MAILLWLTVGTFGLALLMALAATMLDAPGRRRIVSRAFWCPFRDRTLTVEFEVEGLTLRPVDVRSCSAFDPPETVICHKRCRDLSPAAPAARR